MKTRTFIFWGLHIAIPATAILMAMNTENPLVKVLSVIFTVWFLGGVANAILWKSSENYTGLGPKPTCKECTMEYMKKLLERDPKTIFAFFASSLGIFWFFLTHDE